MKLLNRSAITVFGTEVFLEWVKKVCPELHRWNLDSLNHHPNVYLVEVEDQNCWGDCFETHYKTIFENEIADYIRHDEESPAISLELFRCWFKYEYHEAVHDLDNEKIEAFDE